MPTPDGETAVVPGPHDSSDPRAVHATCPPDQDAGVTHTIEVGQHQVTVTGASSATIRPPPPPPPSVPTVELQASAGASEVSAASTLPAADTDSSAISSSTSSQRTTPSPMAIGNAPKSDPDAIPPAASSPTFLSPFPPPLRSAEQPIPRSMPQHTSSLLRNGSKFVGTQQSDRQVYSVSVELKHVDMRESFICGYLRIEGLTPDHPTLTTYFEGEIIGTKYTFQTRHAEWGVNEKVDMQHWNRFPAWRPLARQARSRNFSYKNYADREHLFMRWKEYFLVPNHRVTSISGASFEGFYYICFNQVSGSVSGIYFHSKSEKFQQLELKHVHDYGCKGALEFA